MKLHILSYRYAQEILQHSNNIQAWREIIEVLQNAPLFIYQGKSKNNKNLLVVQQVMNTYFDRRFGVDMGWQYHPLATKIKNSGLAADFRKKFPKVVIQIEVQFGNMSRWYSDIFKFQAAYSQSLIQLGISVVPVGDMARITDSNVVNYERAARELPSAELSITLPILMIGLEKDSNTPIVDLRKCKFRKLGEITGKKSEKNRLRIVHGYLNGVSMAEIGPKSEIGPEPQALSKASEDFEDEEI